MATSSFDTSALRNALPALHPLSSLTKDELKLVSATVKSYNASKGECLFRRIYFMEPNKKAVIAYLKAENAGLPLPPLPPRRAQALFYFKGQLPFIECIVDIGSGKVVGQRVLEGMHGAGELTRRRAQEVARAEADPTLWLAQVMTRRCSRLLLVLSPVPWSRRSWKGCNFPRAVRSSPSHGLVSGSGLQLRSPPLTLTISCRWH